MVQRRTCDAIALLRLLGMGAAVGTAAIGSPASAFELFGHKFFESDTPPEELSPDAQRYDVDVRTPGADDDLAETIRGASALWTGREDTPPPSTAAFLSRVKAEYGRITAALYREGRYGGSVDIRVDGRDPAALAPDTVLPQPAPVTITVDPGPLFRFGGVHFEGRALDPAGPDDRLKESPDSIGLVSGQPARAGAVLQVEKILVEEWRQRGHPLATIVRRDTVANHDSNTLDVTVAVDPGPAATFGPVTVTGAQRMNPSYTAYMTGIVPGTPYDPDTIARGQKNLRRLQVFSSQRVEEAKALTPDGRLPLTLNVAERPPRVIGGGASYSTLDGAGLEAYWQHRNLFGQAENLKLSAEVSGIDSVDPADFTYEVSALFSKPGVFTPFTDLNIGLTADREVLDAYTETAVKGSVGLSHAFSEELSASLGIEVVAARDEDQDGSDKFLLAGLPGTLAYDSRDDKTDPHAGYTASLGLEPFYEAEYGNAGAIAEAKATAYWSPFSDGGFVLATRLALGSIVGAPRDEMPSGRLYYSGGGSSIRGYAYRNVGPTEDGEVVGGLSYAEASVELRMKLSESFGGVLFADAGNAFASSYPDFAEGVKIGVGAGIRYYTGLGPVRLDVALPLDPGKDDPSFAIYVGLGQSF